MNNENLKTCKYILLQPNYKPAISLEQKMAEILAKLDKNGK